MKRMNEPGKVEVYNEQAWERYLEAEKRELEMRREGHLARILDGPLPGESPQELERLAEEDRLRAQEGLVELKSESGEIIYKPFDSLTPQDRSARIRAEGERVAWIIKRLRKRLPPSHATSR
jgi:hypothetical protein